MTIPRLYRESGDFSAPPRETLEVIFPIGRPKRPETEETGETKKGAGKPCPLREDQSLFGGCVDARGDGLQETIPEGGFGLQAELLVVLHVVLRK